MPLFMCGVLQHINNLAFCIGSEGGFSLGQAVCNFHIQHISILSFLPQREGPFSLSQAVFSSLESSILVVY